MNFIYIFDFLGNKSDNEDAEKDPSLKRHKIYDATLRGKGLWNEGMYPDKSTNYKLVNVDFILFYFFTV